MSPRTVTSDGCAGYVTGDSVPAPVRHDVTWSSLDGRARAFRVAHAVFAVVQLGSLGYIWTCALTRHRDRALGSSVGALLLEGTALVIGRGDCPMGPFQRSLGDPVPMFEWVLPRRAAKAAIPVLAAVSVAGVLALLLRGPSATTLPSGVDGPRC